MAMRVAIWVAQRLQQKSASLDPCGFLSAREYQVFCLLVEGTRAKEIGVLLGRNPKTIDTYRVNLMHKLDIHHVPGLVKFAMQRDLTMRPSRDTANEHWEQLTGQEAGAETQTSEKASKRPTVKAV